MMARQLGVGDHAAQMQLQSLQRQIRLGIWIDPIALFWMVIKASIALTTGFATRSVSLEGFGIDSIIELVLAIVG